MKKIVPSIFSILFILIIFLAYYLKPETASAKFYSIIPPLFAIFSVFLVRNVFASLLAASIIGAFLLNGLKGFLTLFNVFSGIITSWGNLEIFLMVICFLMFVAILINSGGFLAIVKSLEKKIESKRSAQFITAILGVIVFIDGYANALIVGSVARPLTDRFKISREKLSFIVDATSSPIAGLAIVSTWIAFEVGLFEQMNTTLGLGTNGLSMFLKALPYRFYCIFMLIFVFVNILSKKDFGPMAKAENLMGDYESKNPQVPATVEIESNITLNIWTALLPFLALFITLIIGLFIFGLDKAMSVLLMASFLTVILSFLTSKVLAKQNFKKILINALKGAKSSILPLLIIISAWGLKTICTKLGTGQYLIESIGHLFSCRISSIEGHLISSIEYHPISTIGYRPISLIGYH